jgi:general secretion pathway protein L
VTLQDVLNADVSLLGGWLRQGWTWWIDELGGMLPAGWRRGGRAGGPWVEMGAEAEPARLWRRGRVTALLTGATRRTLAAEVALSEGQVLVRSVVVPAVGAEDLRRLAAVELDRWTPFRPEAVYFDVEPIERDRAAGRQTVRVGVVPRADAEAALVRAAGLGIAPQRLGALVDGERRFDFLPQIRAAGRGGRPDRRRLYWWLAAAALLLANLALLVFKDIDDVGALRAAVDLQRPTVTLALKLRQRVEAETEARRALLARRAHNEPLRIEEAVTRAFPAPQWIQRLEWNGRTLRLVGYRDPAFDALAAVQTSPVLGRPHALSGYDAPAPGAKAPFDLVSEPGDGPRR